jgi:hypothetical protein
MLCTGLLEKVQGDIVSLKGAVASSGKEIYKPSDLSAAIDSGTVDTEKLKEALKFSSETQKIALKMVGEMVSKRNKPPPAEPEWEKFESHISAFEPGLVASVKKVYEDWLKDPKVWEEIKKDEEKSLEDMKAQFVELKSEALKAEKEADAVLLQTIADLELMEKQIANVSTQTIAEILEMEPELRKEVEAEIDNQNWAP